MVEQLKPYSLNGMEITKFKLFFPDSANYLVDVNLDFQLILHQNKTVKQTLSILECKIDYLFNQFFALHKLFHL